MLKIICGFLLCSVATLAQWTQIPQGTGGGGTGTIANPATFMPPPYVLVGDGYPNLATSVVFIDPVTGVNSPNGFTVTGLASGCFNVTGSSSLGIVSFCAQDATGTWTFKPPTSAGTAGQVIQTDGAGTTSWASHPRNYTAVYVNGGSTLVAGATVTKYLTAPVGCTVNAWNINAYPSGTVLVDVWRVADGTALPNSGNTLISGANYLTNVNTHIHSTTLTGFTVNPPVIVANDVLALNLQGITGAPTWASVELVCQ